MPSTLASFFFKATYVFNNANILNNINNLKVQQSTTRSSMSLSEHLPIEQIRSCW